MAINPNHPTEIAFRKMMATREALTEAAEEMATKQEELVGIIEELNFSPIR
jgi:hypothetical protein